jgi:hypothetical protein
VTKLIILTGEPGSGKTTRAYQWFQEDEANRAIAGRLEDAVQALHAGRDVILDSESNELSGLLDLEVEVEHRAVVTLGDIAEALRPLHARGATPQAVAYVVNQVWGTH